MGRVKFGDNSRIINVLDYGADPSGTVDSAAAITAAIQSFGPASTPRGGTVQLPPGTFKILSPIHVTRGIVLEGAKGYDPPSTTIQPALGISAIIVDTPASSPDTGRGDGSIIRAICIRPASAPSFWQATHAQVVGDVRSPTSANYNHFNYVCTISGTTGGTEPAWGGPNEGDTIVDGGVTWKAVHAHGIEFKARALLEDFSIVGMGCDGIYISASVFRTPSTNANGWAVDYGVSEINLGNGIYVQGSDSNNGKCSRVTFSSNGQWGVFDSSFLGNTWDTCECDGNAAGPYWCFAGPTQSQFVGCYSEGGGGTNQIAFPSVILGGIGMKSSTLSVNGLIEGEFTANSFFTETAAGRFAFRNAFHSGRNSAINWPALTAVTLNELVVNNGRIYKCTTPGVTASSGGPTGTGTGIIDGAAVWSFYCYGPIGNWCAEVQQIVDGVIVPQTNDIVINNNPSVGAPHSWRLLSSGYKALRLPDFDSQVLQPLWPLDSTDLALSAEDYGYLGNGISGGTRLDPFNVTGMRSRIGGYTLAFQGPSGQSAQDKIAGARRFDGRPALGLGFFTSNCWIQLAASADHTIQATDQLTFESVVYYSPNGLTPTIIGYENAAATCGYAFQIADSDGHVSFNVFNTTSGNYLSAATPAAALTTGHFYHLLVTVDMNTPVAKIYVNGVLAGTSGAALGSYTAAQAPVAFCGLVKNGALVVNTQMGSAFLIDFMRHRAILTSTQIKTRGSIALGL